MINFIALWFSHLNMAYSAAICPMARSEILDARALTGFIQDVNIIGKPDRQTAEDFARGETTKMTAAKIEKRYAASGDLVCGTQSFGQAQVVLKNDIIVTVGHVLRPNKGCPLPPAPPLSSCTFSTTLDHKTVKYEIERVVDTGYVCKPGMKRPGHANDWAVLKLKKPVDSKIKPYQISKDPTDIDKQVDLVQVAKSVDFNPTHATIMTNLVRHYGRCDMQFSDPRDNYIETDCDASGGSSGGGVFTPGENPTLVAVSTSGSGEPCPDGNGLNDVGAYRRGCWVSTAAKISGDFLTALQRAGGQGSDSNPGVQPPATDQGADDNTRWPRAVKPDFKDL